MPLDLPQLAAVPLDPPQLAAVPLDPPQLAAVPLDPPQLAAVPLDPPPLAAVPLDPPQLAAVPLDPPQLAAAPLDPPQLAAVPLDPPPLAAVPLDPPPLAAVPLDPPPLAAVPLDPPQLAAVPLDPPQLAAVPLDPPQLAAAPLDPPQLAAVPLDPPQLAAVPLDPPQLAVAPLDPLQLAAAPQPAAQLALPPAGRPGPWRRRRQPPQRFPPRGRRGRPHQPQSVPRRRHPKGRSPAAGWRPATAGPRSHAAGRRATRGRRAAGCAERHGQGAANPQRPAEARQAALKRWLGLEAPKARRAAGLPPHAQAPLAAPHTRLSSWARLPPGYRKSLHRRGSQQRRRPAIGDDGTGWRSPAYVPKYPSRAASLKGRRAPGGRLPGPPGGMFAMKPRCPAEAEGEASDAFGQLLLVRCGKYAEQRAIKEGPIPLHALAEEDADLMAAQLGNSVRQTAGAARAVPGRKGAGRSAAGAGGLPAGHLAAEDRRGHDDRGPRREGARSHDGGQPDAWPAVCDAGEAQAAAQAQADVFRAGSRSLCTRMARPGRRRAGHPRGRAGGRWPCGACMSRRGAAWPTLSPSSAPARRGSAPPRNPATR
ncbi:hypothetical protein PLESTF_000194300 [Pleodorina starrii]|nr:hypothetical protein PLESTF_000194300 [Pleodorina starrii]